MNITSVKIDIHTIVFMEEVFFSLTNIAPEHFH